MVGCPRKDCNIAAKTKTAFGQCYDVVSAKNSIADENIVEIWSNARKLMPDVWSDLRKRILKRGEAHDLKLLAHVESGAGPSRPV
jgi:hypothetical protein